MLICGNNILLFKASCENFVMKYTPEYVDSPDFLKIDIVYISLSLLAVVMDRGGQRVLPSKF